MPWSRCQLCLVFLSWFNLLRSSHSNTIPTPEPNTTLTGKPLFGTLISLLHNGVPVVGIIDQPILQERWVGIAGQHTTLNGKKINTRMCRDPKLAYLYATTPHMFAGEPAGSGWGGWGRGKEDEEGHDAQSTARIGLLTARQPECFSSCTLLVHTSSTPVLSLHHASQH